MGIKMGHNETVLFYFTDDLMNVTALTDDQGAVVERYRYDDFGYPSVFDPSGSPRGASIYGNPYLWNGRRWGEGLNEMGKGGGAKGGYELTGHGFLLGTGEGYEPSPQSASPEGPPVLCGPPPGFIPDPDYPGTWYLPDWRLPLPEPGTPEWYDRFLEDFNCHGWGWLGGEPDPSDPNALPENPRWINFPDYQIERQHAEEVPWEDMEPGDLILYYLESGGRATHTGVAWGVDENGTPMVVGKWSMLPYHYHPYNVVPQSYGVPREVYRQPHPPNRPFH